jgi:hypothetical protein
MDWEVNSLYKPGVDESDENTWPNQDAPVYKRIVNESVPEDLTYSLTPRPTPAEYSISPTIPSDYSCQWTGKTVYFNQDDTEFEIEYNGKDMLVATENIEGHGYLYEIRDGSKNVLYQGNASDIDGNLLVDHGPHWKSCSFSNATVENTEQPETMRDIDYIYNDSPNGIRIFVKTPWTKPQRLMISWISNLERVRSIVVSIRFTQVTITMCV